MFASLGRVVLDSEIESMIREAPGDINFTSRKINSLKTIFIFILQCF